MMKNNYNRFTIIIPTYNRPEYLKRILSYYLHFGITILVADSSNEIFPYIDDYKNKIIYKHTPQEYFAKKVYDISKFICSPYIVMCADDDFIIPETINQIINFLEKNLTYKSGQGLYLTFSYNNNIITNTLKYKHLIGENLFEDSSYKRILHLMGNYFHFYYSVYHTDIFVHCYENLIHENIPIITNLNLLEIFNANYTAINGKHIILPLLYSAREKISDSAGSYTDGMDKVISQKKYRTEYKNFINLLSEHLSKTENISFYNAKHIIKKAIRRYMNKHYSKKKKIINFINVLKTHIKTYFVIILKNIGLYPFIYKIKSYIKPNKKSVDKSFPFSTQDLEQWEIIKDYILQYKYIYQ